MAKRRFQAPPRAALDPATWAQPLFAPLQAYRDWLQSLQWPRIAAMDAALAGRVHPHSGQSLRLVEQDEALLVDGLHYETRIFLRGQIATRADNWHDLFNALAWLQHGALKAALNTRQHADVQRLGAQRRSRGQEAMTQFDEAGAVVYLADAELLSRWDAHDWKGLFLDARDAWHDGRIRVELFGHALYEHALHPAMLLVGKCLAVFDPEMRCDRAAVATAIAAGEVLNDPQELRPLPLSGIPGWHPQAGTVAFYADAPCFRPLRAGRRYPQAMRVE